MGSLGILYLMEKPSGRNKDPGELSLLYMLSGTLLLQSKKGTSKQTNNPPVVPISQTLAGSGNGIQWSQEPMQAPTLTSI